MRVEFTIGAARNNPVPSDLVARAQARLEQERDAKQIEDFILYPERLKAAWEAARTFQGPKELGIVVILGQGFPKKNSVVVSESSDPKVAFHLTLKDTGEEWRKWLPEMLEAAVLKAAAAKKIECLPNRAQIHHVLVHAQGSNPVDQIPILATPEGEEDQKGYRMIGNRARREAFFVITNRALLDRPDVEELVLRTAEDAVSKLIERGDAYQLRKADIISEVRRARFGPERLGVELPLIILMGTAAPERPRAAAPMSAPAKPRSATLTPDDVPEVAPRRASQRGLLQISIGERNLEAFIERLDGTFYQSNPELQPTTDWVKAELRDRGVKYGINEKSVGEFIAKMLKKEEMSNIVLAVGKEPKAQSEPYLHPSYRDNKTKDMTGVINLRDFQSMDLVRKGELIAVVSYKNKAEPGRDVLGREIPPPPPAPFSVTVGEGVEARNGGRRFYSTDDGMPQMEEKSIMVSKTYLHKGDVNLKSGNVYFQGGVVIEGSIDHGATVIVGGDLLVKGSIGAASVKVKGNIEAMQGIVTTEKGRVQANGSVRALFIDNSNICCGKDVFVHKSVINSQVIAGGAIDATSQGVIAGGELSCKDVIKTGRLGFPQGAKTICHVGIDWRIELKVRIWTRRLASLERKEIEDRNNLREFTRKSAAQMTPKHKDMQKKLQERLVRIRAISTRVESKLALTKAGLQWDKAAKIYVHGNLVTNVEMEVGGIKIPVRQELIGVILSTRKYKDSYISPLEEVVGKEKDQAS